MFEIKKFIGAWDSFFFHPESTLGIGAFRIIWCSLLLVSFLCDLPHFYDFFGPHGLISLSTVKTQFQVPHLNIFHWMGVSYSFLSVFMVLYGIALVAGILGFYTRHALVFILIGLVSLHQRNIWFLSSSEVLMRIVCVYMIFSPAGRSLSLDAYFAKKEGRPWSQFHSPWVLRLIQIQLSVVYVWTVWHKLKGDTWFDGTALYYASRLENMTNFPVPFLFDSVFFIKLMTWGTLILELALGTLIWFKEFRKPLLIAGVFFHLGIEYTMSIPFFELVMMALLFTFVRSAEVERALESMKSRIQRLRLKVQESYSEA